MKKNLILSFFLLLSVIAVNGQQQLPATAQELMSVAAKLARLENKKIFVMFHASWCGWCKRMDKSMEDPSCKKFFDENYVIVHMVVNESKDKKHLENPGAEEMLEKYNGKGKGIPFWLIFDQNSYLLADAIMRKEDEGPEKGDNTGCPASEKEVAHFIDMLKKTSHLDESQLEIIRKRFRENDN